MPRLSTSSADFDRAYEHALEKEPTYTARPARIPLHVDGALRVFFFEKKRKEQP